MNLKNMNSVVMDIEEIKYTLSRITIFDKLKFSDVTKQDVKTALDCCVKTADFLIWIESVLKHWIVKRTPEERDTIYPHVKADAVRRDILYLFENVGLIGGKVTIEDIKEWANSAGED